MGILESIHLRRTAALGFCWLGLAPTSTAAAASPATVLPAAIAPIEAPFAMPQLQRPVFPNRTFAITAFGAQGDGATKNTKAFAGAIAACRAAGGGRVVVPAGKWLTGAIHLQSNVNLHLEEGAEIHFSDDRPTTCRWCSPAGRGSK